MSAEETLVALLAPQDPSAFLAEQWGSRSCLLPGGTERAARWPVPIEQVERLLADTANLPASQRPWRVVGRDDRIAELDGCEGLRSLLADGSTVCVDEMDEQLPVLRQLASDVKTALNHPGRVFISAYASGPDAGFGFHFDYHDTFVLQLIGSKHWRVGAEPAVAWPPVIVANERSAHAAARRYPWMTVEHPTASGEAGLVAHTLHPGDVLYVPAGTWHQARGASELSLALSIACMPISAADLVDDLLRGRLGHRPAWRASLPPVLADSCTPDRLPDVVEGFLAGRLAELRAALVDLTPADFYPLWVERVAAVECGETETQQVSETVDVEDTLICPDVRQLRFVRGVAQLSVFYGDVRVTLDPAAFPVLQRLVDGQAFKAGDAAGWVAGRWDDVADALAALLHAGVLRRVERTSAT